MIRRTISLDEDTDEALQEILREYEHVNRSEIVRQAVRKHIQDSDDVPEWLQKTLKRKSLVDKSIPGVREATFKQRVHDKLLEMLEYPNGEPKKYPPSPDKLENTFFESLQEEIQQVTREEWREEFEQFIEDQKQWYRWVHPDTMGTDKKENYQKAVEYCARHWVMGRADLAVDMAERLESRGELPKHKGAKEVIRDARDRAEGYDPEEAEA